MFRTNGQNVDARFRNLEDHSAAAAGQKALRDLIDDELALVEGGGAVLVATSAGGDTHAPYNVNPWYSATYARFALRTGAPL